MMRRCGYFKSTEHARLFVFAQERSFGRIERKKDELVRRLILRGCKTNCH